MNSKPKNSSHLSYRTGYRQAVGQANKLNGFFRKNKQKYHYFSRS